MHFSRRHRAGPELVAQLDRELAALQRAHPRGFVVRLHILGDFYSVAYAQAWAGWLDRFPALHVFGYTARPRHTSIGAAVVSLRDRRWDRFAVRSSTVESAPASAVTIDRIPEAARVAEGIVCPAQTGGAETCGRCGLCWALAARDKTIVFVLHGAAGSRRPSAGAHLPTATPTAANEIHSYASLPKQLGVSTIGELNPADTAHREMPASSLAGRFLPNLETAAPTEQGWGGRLFPQEI